MSRVKVNYCKRCVMPSSSAAPVGFDDDGVCTGCRTAQEKDHIDWDRRKSQFAKLLEEYRSKDGTNYDCIIPVSGGKDSYFQIHVIKTVMGMNPLLVTYHGNNYTQTGLKNLRNMQNVFNVDHIFFTPSIDVLIKMNRLCFRLMGDMNWHAHSGIFTYPIRVALQTNVPLMIWGEHGFLDMGGMYSYNDFPEFTYRLRHEHGLRGYEWYDMTDEGLEAAGKGHLKEGLTKKDLIPWMYPSDADIERVGVRGVYVGNYFRWEPNDHTPLVMEKYGFQVHPEPFERTHRRMSNLDDMHENGVHDYLKYIKFGYGRATDHSVKDIRDGRITREQGIERVRSMDHVKPRDLYRWLEYVGMSESEFDETADTFRDKRYWTFANGQWVKNHIWDENGPATALESAVRRLDAAAKHDIAKSLSY